MKKRWRRIGGAVLMVVTVLPLLAQAQGEEDLIIITKGMSCAGCSGGLSAMLQQLKGVKAVESDWQSNTTRVILKEGETISLSEIQEAVEEVMGGMLGLVDVKFAKKSSGQPEE
ncbi:MAG: heavy-metal-associated domain-containing protein [Desulfovibrio sp.]|nr:heavy-metal-associated domain-containing protein [Desulfovibrio sp.]